MSTKYEEAGVSLQSGYESIERIKKHIEGTKSLGFNGDIGGFGGFFNLFKYAYKEPVLVSGTDGVGTKLILAIELGTYHTIGQDGDTNHIFSEESPGRTVLLPDIEEVMAGSEKLSGIRRKGYASPVMLDEKTLLVFTLDSRAGPGMLKIDF